MCDDTTARKVSLSVLAAGDGRQDSEDLVVTLCQELVFVGDTDLSTVLARRHDGLALRWVGCVLSAGIAQADLMASEASRSGDEDAVRLADEEARRLGGLLHAVSTLVTAHTALEEAAKAMHAVACQRQDGGLSRRDAR